MWVGRGNARGYPGPNTPLEQSESRTRLLRCGQAPSLICSQQHRVLALSAAHEQFFLFLLLCLSGDAAPCSFLGLEINGATNKDQRLLVPSDGWKQELHPCYFHHISVERGTNPELRGSLGT